MKNYLPPVPKHEEQDAKALSAYRHLGVMALLDIDYWQGQSELPIGDQAGMHRMRGMLAWIPVPACAGTGSLYAGMTAKFCLYF